jgi:hypothetical protein
MKKKVVVNDKMQKGYEYFCTEPIGKNFDLKFKPEFSPAQILKMGVFGGRYMRDCEKEYPKSWFKEAKLSLGKPDYFLNYFGVRASQSLADWQKKGWIHPQDPRGWFQWYCRYYLGRRMEDDQRQIGRWRAMKRHVAQVKKNCQAGDRKCRPVQRQVLLQWAYDSRKI